MRLKAENERLVAIVDYKLKKAVVKRCNKEDVTASQVMRKLLAAWSKGKINI